MMDYMYSVHVMSMFQSTVDRCHRCRTSEATIHIQSTMLVTASGPADSECTPMLLRSTGSVVQGVMHLHSCIVASPMFSSHCMCFVRAPVCLEPEAVLRMQCWWRPASSGRRKQNSVLEALTSIGSHRPKIRVTKRVSPYASSRPRIRCRRRHFAFFSGRNRV